GRGLLDFLIDVEADGRVDALDVAGTTALVGREHGVVIEVGERLRGELATAVTGRLVDRDEVVVEVVALLLQVVQAVPHRVVVPLRDVVVAGTTATGGRDAAAARA